VSANLFESESHQPQEGHWIALSDLMTGLMVLFLLIAVIYMMRVEADSSRIREVAVAYNDTRDALYQDLYREFEKDLPKWKAELVKSDMSIRFTDPDILFANGKSDLKPDFQQILRDFFPRYERILASPKYRSAITEIRIEGHTSSEWIKVTTPDDAYFHNMELSQARTRSVLSLVLELPESTSDRAWLKRYVTANGLSSSQPILDQDQHEDQARSRRVVFRVRTDAETRIEKILEASSP
jgi:outer membrane protein OmpA-like peptidoglycan-associated protein